LSKNCLSNHQIFQTCLSADWFPNLQIGNAANLLKQEHYLKRLFLAKNGINLAG